MFVLKFGRIEKIPNTCGLTTVNYEVDCVSEDPNKLFERAKKCYNEEDDIYIFDDCDYDGFKVLPIEVI